MPSIQIPEPPIREQEFTARAWVRWFQELRRTLATQITTAVDWVEINFTGSNLTDLATRNHADLQNINTATYMHLSATNHTDLTDGGATTLHHHTSAPTFNVGNVAGGNYTEFEADGTLEMHGTATVWRDELGDLLQFQSTGAGVSVSTTEASIEFTTGCNATNDYVFGNVQLNHDRLNGAVIQPHLHWWQVENNEPHWLLKYRWQKNGSSKVTAWTDLKLDTLAATYVSGTLNQISYNAAGITPPAGDGVSDILQFRLTRDTTSTVYVGADPYTVTASATSFDVHIEIDTLGSRSEYSK